MTSREKLRYGWTTGACASAATRAAYTALLTGEFPDPVSIVLPQGQTPSFSLAHKRSGENWAEAGIIKDAGDDPDVTHGALIKVRVKRNDKGSGVTFKAGDGVGMVTRPGLPIPPGEPAINPAPRKMMREVIGVLAAEYKVPGDVVIEVSVPDGEKMAKKTWNGRLGIIGGISILGTTGIVVPYSCSAWIHSIHSGIDVARAAGRQHIGAAVGSTSEKLLRSVYDMPLEDIVDMGDFVGGMIKYLRRHTVPKISIAGGFAKMSKLASGQLDLHSKRSQVDQSELATWLAMCGASSGMVARAENANTALEILQLAAAHDLPLGNEVARRARKVVLGQMRDADVLVEILICDRDGQLVGRAPEAGL